MYAIDTNVLVYAFDANEKEKHTKAKSIVKATFLGEQKTTVTNQILAEFVYIATTKLTPRMSSEEVERIVRSIRASRNWKIINYTENEVLTATQLKKHFWDSLIAATLKDNITLLTENTKHFAHTTLETKNPFIEELK